jgi:predicted DNA-binding protein
MERRLQLLLDQERYDRVAAEAKRSGRSVASVIREAIDLRFDDVGAHARRAVAARRFLDMTAHSTHEVAYEPAERNALLDRELDEHLDRLDQQ